MMITLAQTWTDGFPAVGRPAVWGILLVAVAFAASPLGRVVARFLGKGVDGLAGKRGAAITSVGILSLVMSAIGTLMLLERMPRASIHDEFSYLLMGETFAAGRLANRPHAMWRFFETPHVIQRPTYASKYPPGQGAMLALGMVLADEAIVGVWVGTALACAAVCWALYAWTTARWALLGGLIAALHPSVVGWTFVYWGGAMSLLGGALLVGAAGRLRERVRLLDVALLGLGLGVLAITRPLEGVIVAMPMMIMLLMDARRRWKEERKEMMRGIGVLAGVLGVFVLFMGYYNLRVTGRAETLPYALHHRTYSFTPHFVFQSLKERPEYGHADLLRFHVEVESEQWRKQQSFGGWGREVGGKILEMVKMGLQPAVLIVPLALLPWLLREEKRLRWVAGSIALLGIVELFVTWGFWQHYAAPALAMWFVLVVACLRRLAQMHWKGTELGGAAVRVIGAFIVFAAWERMGVAVANQKEGWQNTRQTYIDALENEVGEDLVIVRYLPGHDIHQEWVYNAAEIDAAPIVWARDLGEGENAALLDYFKGRRRWLLEVDGKQARLGVYPSVGD